MEISTTPAPAASQPATPQSSGTGSAGALASDFDTFLPMLTTQLQNQDPLNPANAQDFAVDLATFSGVEQQIRTNDLLEGLAEAQTLSGLAGYADWIGQEARAVAPTQFTGEPVALTVTLPPAADQATVSVVNASGRVVSEFAIPPTSGDVVWDGTDALGAPVPEGLYSFSVSASAEGSALTGATAETYNRIAEVRLEAGRSIVVFDNGANSGGLCYRS